MSDARDSARTPLLTAWLADAQRIGARPEGSVRGTHPAPPSELTPDDVAAAGFEFYDEAAARYVRDVRCQVNFTPDLEHQAVFVQGPGRHGSAFLWMDGQAVPIPIDATGDPQIEALLHWLDHRFSKGLLAAVQNPARAVSLWSWTTEAGRIATQGQHSFRHAYPAPPRGLTTGDCEAVGFEFDEERSADSFLDEGGQSTVHAEFSPDLHHQAVLIKRASDWSGALLWVDGEPVPVPRSASGDPMCKYAAEWLDNRFVYAQIGLPDPGRSDPLGEIRGLLIWDATQHVRYMELPESAQIWTHPILIARNGSWRIYPNGAAFKQDSPDRVLPIPP
jgi:hypothetical protein